MKNLGNNKNKYSFWQSLIGMTLMLGLVGLAVFSRPPLALEELVLASDGIVVPIKWGDLGAKMVEVGAIDAGRFEDLYANRGGLDQEFLTLLYGEKNNQMVINSENAGPLLNLFWALGLSNKNPILETGPMASPQYGGDPSVYASTGGWTLSVGEPMRHYSKHSFIFISLEDQAKVERVAQGVFRPCCGNPVHFPDCNHGMAMLGLLELMAANDVSEEEMYEVALKVNSYWFPDVYLTLAQYFQQQGTSWDEVDPRVALSYEYSSSRGFQKVLAEVEPENLEGGSNCAV